MLDLEASCCREGWDGTVRYDAFGEYSLLLRYVSRSLLWSRIGVGHASKSLRLTLSLLLVRFCTAMRPIIQICCGVLEEPDPVSPYETSSLSGSYLREVGFPAIVTRFYLKTRPRPPFMYRSTFIYPICRYKSVMDWITKVPLPRFRFSVICEADFRLG
jgi:hypothetical protein